MALREIVERLAGDEYEFEIITVNLDGNQPAIEKYVRRWCDAWVVVSWQNIFSRLLLIV